MIPTADRLTLCTARLECELANGTHATGTGFFFAFDRAAQRHIVLVTNAHVVADAVRGRFDVHRAGPGGLPVGPSITVVLDDVAGRWVSHPDPSVDLGVLRVQASIEAEEARAGTVSMSMLDPTWLASTSDLESLSAIEDIVMVGYPDGLWDRANNRPIVRRGITATHPALDWEGRQEFLIDAACYPGSSGSPVFLYNAGSYGYKEGGLVIGSRLKLLGVLHAGPMHTAEGEIVIRPVPTQRRAVVETRIPINLGLVLKASRLLEIGPLLGD